MFYISVGKIRIRIMASITQMMIETERLIIRPYIKSDLQEAFELMQEKDLFHYLPMDVMDFDDYKELFAWLIKCYETTPDQDWFKYSFVIIRKEDMLQIGWCGVGSLDYSSHERELFYLIGKPYWGNGYATEAVEGLIQYSFDELKLSMICAVIKPENKSSRRVLEKLGFRYERIISDLPEEYDFYNGELYYILKRPY